MSLVTAYLCLGSNINPEQHIAVAVQRIQQDYPQTLLSNLYRCAAVGFEGDDFLNVALAIETDRSLADLLDYADMLEQKAGRVRLERGRFDARTLDVDLIMYGDLRGFHQGRHWPSKDIDEFAHVLCPLADIAAAVRHPLSGKTFATLWAEFASPAGSLKRVDRVW